MIPEFLPVVAKVSATFVGLVFVGLSIYLTSIHSASSELEAELNLVEQSTSLVFVSIISNLSFFLFPLITSLTLIAQQGRPNYLILMGISFGFCGLLSCVLFGAHENKEIKQWMRIIKERKLLRCRIGYGKYVVYLAALMYLLSSLMHVLEIPSKMFAEDFFRFIAIISIVLGLGFGIADLYLYNINNILFKVSEKFQGGIENLRHNLQRYMQEIEKLFGEYEEKYGRLKVEPIPPLSPNELEAYIRDLHRGICARYNRLREEIPKDRDPKIIRRIKAKGEVITYSDVKEIQASKDVLFEEIGEYLGLLNEKIQSIEDSLAKNTQDNASPLE